jgi:Fur family ferric uptake transcriptional regulator
MQNTDLIQMLRRQGHRMTPQRLQVLQIVSSHSRDLTAEEIHAAILPQQPSLDIATVYRTLQWLQSAGLIAPLTGSDGRLRYEYHASGNEHHHLICQVCGATIQIPCDMIALLKQELMQRYNFAIDDHLALPGCCEYCRQSSVASSQ